MSEFEVTTRCIICPTVTCKWKIENFLSCTLKAGGSLFTPSFACHDGMWSLIIYPDGASTVKVGKVQIGLRNNLLRQPQCDIILHVGLEDNNGILQCTSTNSIAFRNQSIWIHDNFIDRQMLLGKRQEVLLPEGNLTVVCKITQNTTAIAKNSVIQTNEYVRKDTKPLDVVNSLETMAQDFGKLLHSGNLSDVTLKSENQLFTAHKVVLIARSLVFATMLRNDIMESKDNTVEIPDIPALLFPDVLEFMYTGNLKQLPWNKAIMLYDIADRYGMPGLQSICQNVIIDSFSVENFYDIILFAYMHHNEKVKEGLFAFLIHHKREILATQQWNEFRNNHGSLAASILKDTLMETSKESNMVKLPQ